MGLSSNKTKTTSNVDQNTSETTSGTTMPVAPDWLTQAAQDYVGRIGAFGNMDPNQFIAGAAPLQRMAWNNVGNLDDWQGQARAASQLAQASGTGPANLAAVAPGLKPALGTAYTAPPTTIQTTARPRATAAVPQTLGNAATRGSTQIAAPQLGDAALVTGRGYDAPTLGDAQGYAAARTGAPIGAASQGYTAQQAGNATLGPVTNAQASNATAASGLTGLDAWQNPYQQQVVNAALADYDQGAAQQQARLAAQGAKSGAFGGSRFGVAEGQLAGEVARGRGSLSAGLHHQGFNTAAQNAQMDAANRQQTGLFNAQNRTGVSLANAGAANQYGLAGAELAQQRNLFNAGQGNEARQFGAGAANTASLFNASEGNRMAMEQAGRTDAARQFGAGAQNQFDLAQAGLQAEAGQFGAAARNAAGFANQDSRNQFELAQAGMGMQAGLANQASRNAAMAANMGARNQYGLAQFGADTDAAAQLAAAQNQMGLAGYQGNLQTNLAQAGLTADANQFNAGQQNAMQQFNAGQGNQIGMFNNSQANAMNQFNAGQGDNAANRGLQGAALMGDLAGQYSNNTRGDLQLMGQMGDQQRGIEQQFAMAGPAQLQMMGQLSGMTPYQILAGQAVNGQSTGTMQGTNTSTVSQSPSLFSQLLAAGQVGASIFSDRALKRDIVPVNGESHRGLTLYSYRYAWDRPSKRRIGVMADEVGRMHPHALGPAIGGFATVDYAKLGLAHLVEA